MTLTTTVVRNEYVASGITGPYAYNFRILAASDLVVEQLVGNAVTELSYPADYSVSGVGNIGGGSVTLTVPMSTGTLIIRRERPLTQTTSLRGQGGRFDPGVHEDTFDNLMMILQEQQNEIDHALRLPSAYSPSIYDMILPLPIAGQVLTGTGTGWTMSTLVSSANIALPGDGRTVLSVTSYLENNKVWNVRDFYTAGVTTWTQAINNCITACATAGGGYARVPAGAYVGLGQITLQNNVVLRGDGYASSVLTFATAGGVGVVTNVGTHDAHIVGIGFNGNAAAAIGVVFQTSTKCSVKACSFTGFTNSTHATGYAGGVHAWLSDDIDIEGNYFIGNGYISNNPASSDIQTNGVALNTGNLRINIRFNRCLSVAAQANIACYDIQRSEIVGNVCTGAKTGTGNNNGYGIMLYKTVSNSGQMQHNRVMHNYVRAVGGTGIYLQTTDRSTVVGNVVYDAGVVQDDATLPVGGIALNAAPNSVATGNILLECGKSGITIAGATTAEIAGIVLADNVIESAFTLGIGIFIRGAANRCIIKSNTIKGYSRGIGTNPVTQGITSCVIDSNAISESASRGIDIYGISHSSVSFNTIVNSGGDGMALITATRCRIAGNNVRDGGTLATNTYIAIDMSVAVDCLLEGNMGGNTGGTGYKWGIYCPAGTSSGNVVRGNYFKGCLTANYNVDTTTTNSFWGNYDAGTTYAQFFGVRQQMVLQGAANLGAQMLLGDSSLIGSVGVRGNGNTDVYLGQNVVQVFGGDTWHQSSAGSASKLWILRINGDAEFYSAPAGTADAVFATFWGVAKVALTAAGAIKSGGTQVLAARDTGWTAMTNTANKNTAYDTTTVTLPQLAARVKSLQDALTTHGVIGA